MNQRLPKIFLVLCIAFTLSAHVQQQSLLIFQDTYKTLFTDITGMNVAHQVLTGLIQKAAPMIVAYDVWNHVLKCQQRFKKNVHDKKSQHYQIQSLVNDVNRMVVQGSTVKTLNETFNNDWYNKQYSELAKLNSDVLKTLKFDYFCSNIFDILDDWNVYSIDNAYILFLPKNSSQLCFNMLYAQRLSQHDILQQCEQNKRSTLIDILSKILLIKNIRWNMYLTGHGQHADNANDFCLIAGMLIDQFREFLIFLNTKIKTNILVYSSCYSSGTHLIDSYCDYEKKDLILGYPILVTCLTDAPVYVFGIPAGIKLPPYDEKNYLEDRDIKHQGLTWYLMQNFNDFCKYSLSNDVIKIAQSIVVYQECNKNDCVLESLENIPLFRKKGSNFFIPVDTTYVDCILHDSHESRVVKNKHAILWYIQQYQGLITILDRLPKLISMIPGDSSLWVHSVKTESFTFQQFVKESFFSIDDICSNHTFLCDTFLGQNQTLQHCMVILNNNWVPNFVNKKSLGFCCYIVDDQWYWFSIDSNKQIVLEQKATVEQKNIFKKLWKYLQKKSQYQQDLTADKKFSLKNYQQRKDYDCKLLQEYKRDLSCFK